MSCFWTTARIPAARACTFIAALSCAVYMTTGTSGSIAFKTDPASSPFIAGIEKSITIKSGWSVLAFSMASSPLTASPQTSKLVRDSTKDRSSFRAGKLSSTIRIFLDISCSNLALILLLLPYIPQGRWGFGPTHYRLHDCFQPHPWMLISNKGLSARMGDSTQTVGQHSGSDDISRSPTAISGGRNRRLARARILCPQVVGRKTGGFPEFW